MNLKEKLDIEREEKHRALVNRLKKARKKYLADETPKTPEQLQAEKEANEQAEIRTQQYTKQAMQEACKTLEYTRINGPLILKEFEVLDRVVRNYFVDMLPDNEKGRYYAFSRIMLEKALPKVHPLRREFVRSRLERSKEILKEA